MNNLCIWYVLGYVFRKLINKKIMKALKDLKVFIIDDDNFCTDVVEKILTKLELTDITKFETGFEGLDNIQQKPDVVLLDYNMDHLNGYEVLKKIKRFDPNIYVVMLSAQEDLNVAVDALKLGAFDYIQKGSDMEEKLGVVLKKVISVNKLLAESKPSVIKRIFKLF